MTVIEEQARSIFLAALERAPDQWPAFLDEASGGNAQLRARVDQLLHAHQAMGSIHGGGADAPGATVDEPLGERPGTVIGPYKLLEQIGEGGFGVVFLAEQQQPVRRKVALKVLKPGMDTRQVIVRFEAERQALALMDHPNIAHVFDGGATASGRPYFVMELVKGLAITDFCDQNQLNVRARLELFVSVCQAVQHAHQKGIIHRDIKPSNMLVTLQDGAPLVKVIDFGIAKALGQQLTDKTVYTGFAQLIGTPLYMSPEQAALSAGDVDTRSDIYSLGVLLYELLTGTTPFDRKRLRELDFDELRRIIREEEPPRPSTRISTLGQAATAVSAQRRSDPKRLSQLVRGELDWIVMKALEKDRNRRYETASAFAADVQRYLHDEPVLACPPSAWYRLRKFARRNQAGLAIAACLSLVLATLGGGFGWEMRVRAERAAQRGRELDKAEQEAVTLRNDIISQLDDPEKAKRLIDDQARWEDLLHGALGALQRAEALAATAGAPVEPRAREHLSALRSELESEACHREMVVRLQDIRLDAMELHTEQRLVTSEMAKVRGGAYLNAYRKAFADYGIGREGMTPKQAAGRINRCRPPIRAILVAALAEWFSLAGDSPDERAWVHQTSVGTEPGGWWQQAHTAFFAKDRAALEALAEKVEADKLPAASLVTIARFLDALDRGPVALRLLRRAQAQYPTDFWVNHELASALLLATPPQLEEAVGFRRVAVAVRPKSSVAQSNLCAILIMCKDWDGAIAAGRRAKALQPSNHRAYLNLGSALGGKGDLLAGIAEVRKAIEINPKYAMGHLGLGRALREAKDFPGAIAAFKKAIELFSEQTTHRWILARLCFELGMTREEQKDLPKAIAAYEKALQYNPKLTAARGNLGKALKAKGDLPRAIAEYRKVIEIDPKDDTAYYNLGNALTAQRDFPGALAAFREAIKINSKHEKAYHNLGVVFFYQNKWAEAVAAYRQALVIDPKDAIAHNSLGNALKAQGDLHGAIAAYRESIGHDPKVAGTHFNLGQALEANKDLPGAIEAYREAAKASVEQAGTPPNHWRGFLTAAALLSHCATLAEKDGRLAQEKRKELVEGYARQAVDMLREAIANGYKDASALRQMTALAVLRSRDDFQKLLAEVEAKRKQ
jgi:serine/threonine protein kinase/tetratricopeptide (TPR) repeat protein